MSMVMTIAIVLFMGVTISLLFWSRPSHVKWAAGMSTGAAFLVLLVSNEHNDSIASILMVLFALTALACITGQSLIRQASFCHIMILLILGLSVGSLMMAPPVATLLVVGLMALIALAVWSASPQPAPLRWSTIVSLAAGALSLLSSFATSETTSTILQLIAYATLLPLFPLHMAFVGSVASLPGTVPAFIVVVLPCLGWYELARIAPNLPGGMTDVLMILAVVGALLGIVRAAVQIHVRRILGSIMAALLAVVWWYLGVVGTASPAGGYMAAVMFATSGILIGVHRLESQYGVLDVERLGGLARPMPRFAVLVGLLFMAAMGLPVLGVSSGFMTMIFAASSPKLSMGLVLLIWFVASLLLLKLWHCLFYGRPREDLLYQDLTVAELFPFAVMIALLLLGGRFPSVFPVSTPTVTTAEAPR